MGLLCNVVSWSKTTLVHVVEDAEKREAPKMDSVVLDMENGKTVAIIVITANRDIYTEVAAFRRQIEGV